MKRFLYSLAVAAGGLVPFASADEPKPKPAPEGVKKPAVPAEGVKKPAPDGEKSGVKRVARTAGTLGKIDAAKKSFVLVRKGDGGLREDTYSLAADAVVTIDLKPGKFDALKEGMTVEIATAGEGKGVSEVRAAGVKLQGVVKTATDDSVTFGGKEGKPADRTVKLAPGAKVLVQGKDGKLTDLQGGSKVFVQLTADGNAAILVTDGGPAGTEKKPGAKPEKPGEKKPEGDKPGVKKPEGDKPAVKPEK